MSKEKQIEEMALVIASGKGNNSCKNCEECVCHDIDCIYKNIADILYNAGYRKQEWISVEERLPKEGVRVLVWLKVDNSQYTSIDTDRLSLKKWVRWGRLVTHWRELPEPPKGE